jgi:hypothetical protein
MARALRIELRTKVLETSIIPFNYTRIIYHIYREAKIRQVLLKKTCDKPDSQVLKILDVRAFG